MLEGVIQNMVTPLELIQRVVDGMIARKFGRIINITSASVRTPITGLDLSSGARAGLTAFLAGVAREVAGANVTINSILARRLRYRPHPQQHRKRWRNCRTSISRPPSETG